MRHTAKILGMVAVLLAQALPLGMAAAAPKLTVLHQFAVKPGDLANPNYGLVFDKSGTLYGATDNGIFKLNPPGLAKPRWTETVVSDNFYPAGGLILNGRGEIFAVTQDGGETPCRCGMIFKLTPPPKGKLKWTATELYSFRGGGDGARPSGNLVFDRSGALYGTTESGGYSGNGTVFKLTPPSGGRTHWTKAVLHRFAGGSNGATPVGGLTIDRNGTLYGVTYSGGIFDQGTIFKLTPSTLGKTGWSFTVIHKFAGSPDGSLPFAGLVFDKAGVLYGTTMFGGVAGSQNSICYSGCGTVFRLTPPSAGMTDWAVSVLHSFSDIHEVTPMGRVTFGADGSLYGTTSGDAAALSRGTVFKLTPPSGGNTLWTETVLHRFVGGEGTYPRSSLTLSKDGALYGVTYLGGTGSCRSILGCGSAFKLTP